MTAMDMLSCQPGGRQLAAVFAAALYREKPAAKASVRGAGGLRELCNASDGRLQLIDGPRRGMEEGVIGYNGRAGDQHRRSNHEEQRAGCGASLD